jgi:hypothetical protein
MASNLTADWATDDFLPSQILQAIGHIYRRVRLGDAGRLATCKAANCS